MLRAVLLTFLFTSISLAGESQCIYQWRTICSERNTIGKVVDTHASLHPGLDDKKISVDFKALIEKIKIPRFDSARIRRLQVLVDSLIKVKDKGALEEAEHIKGDIVSVFQIIDIDRIQYALYGIDTFNSRRQTIVVYTFSTNFTDRWNEDHNNYRICYTEEYGVIAASYTNIWDSVIESYELVANCHLSQRGIAIVKQLVAFARSTDLFVYCKE